MKKEIISEIFLTSKFVTEEAWLKLIYEVSRLNGRFRKWEMYVKIELNTIRYFIKSSRELPSVISHLSDFLLKRVDKEEKIQARFKLFYWITSQETNILDIYDKNEVKKFRKLKIAQISILPYCKNNFFFSTKLFFEKKDKKLIKKLALFNIPNRFLSIDFSNYSRFFYKKDAIKFLDIQKSLHLLKSDEKNAFLKVNGFPYLNDHYFLHLDCYDFAKHSLVVGASGSGKSKLISSIITNIQNNLDYQLKYKIVVIDPHAAMENDIGGLENTTVIDFKKIEDSIDLFMNSGKDVVTGTELMLTLFKSLLADLYNSKLERVLRHSIHILLVKRDFSFVSLRKLILEPEYRNQHLKELQEELPASTVDFFLSDFNELKNQSYQEAIAPIISFIDEMQIIPVFNNDSRHLKNIKDVMQENFLTIFSLDQIILGETITKTIAGFIMQQILQLVQSMTFEEHIIFVIDEVAVLENPILRRFLSEARKYNLSLILAQQYFGQISEELQKSIFSNVLNYYIFRVSRADAQILESNIQMEVAVHNSFIVRMKILTELANRECILRVSSNGKVLPAFKGKTLDFVSFPRQKKSQILKTDLIEKNCCKMKKEQKKIDFHINSKVNLKDILSSQSTGRRKVNFNE